MKGETAAYKKNDPARNKIGQGLIMKIFGGEGGIRTGLRPSKAAQIRGLTIPRAAKL